MSDGQFIKFMRTDSAEQMIRKSPNAFILLSIIAQRARRSGSAIMGLDSSQCFVGDFEAYGMTRQQYRTAMRKLEEWGMCAFESTSKGTIAKIASNEIFDINPENSLDGCSMVTNEKTTNITTSGKANVEAEKGMVETNSATNKQPTSNQQATTNKECKNERIEKKVAKATKEKQAGRKEQTQDFPAMYSTYLDGSLDTKSSAMFQTFSELGYVPNEKPEDWEKWFARFEDTKGLKKASLRIFKQMCFEFFTYWEVNRNGKDVWKSKALNSFTFDFDPAKHSDASQTEDDRKRQEAAVAEYQKKYWEEFYASDEYKREVESDRAFFEKNAREEEERAAKYSSSW